MIAHDHATVDGIFFSTRSFGNVRVWFEYGETTTYGQRTDAANLGAGTHPSGYDLATKLRELQGGTTYHFRLCAADDDNQGNPGCSADRTFTTPTTTGPLLTLIPQCWVIDGRRFDAIRITATGLPPGDPGPPPTGVPIGYQTALDGAPFSSPGGVQRADHDGDIDLGTIGFGTDVDRFAVRVFTDPNFNGVPDSGEQILATGSADSACSLAVSR
jgi:hypothetical protein